MGEILEHLQWLKSRIGRSAGLPSTLLARAEALLTSRDTPRAIKALRTLLCLFSSRSDEFKAIRALLLRLDGTYQAQLELGGLQNAAERHDFGDFCVWNASEKGILLDKRVLSSVEKPCRQADRQEWEKIWQRMTWLA